MCQTQQATASQEKDERMNGALVVAVDAVSQRGREKKIRNDK